MILNENLEGSQKLGLCEKNLDIAKGIGIVLVIIGHCIPDASTPQEISEPHFSIIFNVIYSFHMPLFFS
ncbi:MAG: acyltransferase family protein [Selenomonadaceae bacterium]|nr:acyltransferase family protein [Selenomonadaceae bacterium]